MSGTERLLPGCSIGERDGYPGPARSLGRPRCSGRLCGVALAFVFALLAFAGASSAQAAAPWWHLSSRLQPEFIAPGNEGTIVVDALNVGDASTFGAATVSAVLPPGFTVAEEAGRPKIGFFSFAFGRGKLERDMGPNSATSPAFREAHLCGVSGQRVSCTTPSEEQISEFGLPSLLSALQELNPYENLQIRVRVKAPASPGSYAGRAEVQGGGAQALSVARPVAVSSASPSFGVEELSMTPESEGGEVDTQAGSHPFQLTTTVTFNQTDNPLRPPALPRDLQFKLPAGLIGNAQALPQCSELDFQHITEGDLNLCPTDTAVGVASVTIDEPENLLLVTFPVPLFNLTPTRGEPARFGFELAGSPVTLDTSVRTGADYGVNVSVSNVTELVTFLSSTVTFWGVPGSSAHDASRGWGCVVGGKWGEQSGLECQNTPQAKPPPFLTLPTACTSSFEPSAEGVSWPKKASPEGPLESSSFGPFSSTLKDRFERPVGITGCNQLTFSPSIDVKPETQSASAPTGLTTDVHVPQEAEANADGLASSTVRDIRVTLPQGVGLNPAGAGGLEACSEPQIGFREKTSGGDVLFGPSLPSPFCPDAAKVGTAKITTPLLSNPLEGSVYLASQNANPFGSLVALYLVVQDPVSGVLVVLAGEVSLDQSTGQVTATFANNPPLPFEDAKLEFFGGSRAALSTPSRCGSYETQASFTPWSGNPPVAASSSFQITSGPHGGPCPGGSLPFAPTLTAGTTNLQAGAFTPLTTTISREDGDQSIGSVSVRTPPGFSALIASVTPCPEAQANAGSCGPQSLIGHTDVSVGVGGQPFTVTGGQVFLTGGYKGAPFGLSIVTPAKAGPFDLGQVVVRARLDVDRRTAQAIVTTDAEGPYAIPKILDGIPLQIKRVNVTIDRPGFGFNPTNCNPLSLSGSIQGGEGQNAPVAVPFQVTNCSLLKFTPKFTVSTSAKTSKQRGASLTTKLSYPKGPQGAQANIAKVKVSLPKLLPSRLTTLQKACLASVFEANPAACPPQSIVGRAKVVTPLLPVPLAGPAYFVSHGNEAFPNLTVILQGDGVTVELVGDTLIRNGVTTTTFKATPDTPFSSFELTLPQGLFSALTTNANLCQNAAKLIMPTELQAQDGALIKQSTKIAVQGCPKHKKAKHKKAKAKKRHGRGAGKKKKKG
jgi:hypothetical protein